MAKDREKRPIGVLGMVKRALPALLLVAGVVSVCLVGGLVAKYVASVSRSDNQIGANDFYFSIDLLEAQAGEDENQILEREVALYGAGQNSLNFSVRNFFDDLRISGKDIPYTITWPEAVVTVKQGGAVASGGTLTGMGQDQDDYTLSFIDTTQDGEATVTVSSTAPYAKTMTLKVVFHAETYDVLYRVEDAPGNAYANLIVMVGKEDGVNKGQLRFLWDQNLLQIDCTNTHVVELNNGELTVPAGVNAGNIVSSQSVDESGSISILFFKTDMSQDYSKENTVVTADGDSIYPIQVGPAN